MAVASSPQLFGGPRHRLAATAAGLVLVASAAAVTAVAATHYAGEVRPAVAASGAIGSPGGIDAPAIASRILPAVVDVDVTDGSLGGAAATGMVITSTGLVLTNDHVVRGGTAVAVQMGTDSRRWYDASLVGADPSTDVALLQLRDAVGLTTIPTNTSRSLRVGDAIVMAGNALGIGGTPDVSTGVVSALNQDIGASDADGTHHVTLHGMVEVEGTIQQGASGGPMIDRTGHVVAMMAARSADSGPTACYGIPIEKALASVQHILATAWPSAQLGQCRSAGAARACALHRSAASSKRVG